MNQQNFLFLILFFIIFSSLAYACGGSCLECHPKLVPLIENKDHLILKTCVTCHNKPSEKGLCGQDCFACHSKEKFFAYVNIKEHQAIKACSACHVEKADFIAPKQFTSPTQNTLIQILK
ncbi:MAG: hypothetical protein PHN18_05945 [Sulfurospirillaceae bacterium]|nr:hypothetical protein [Sulfurospirillaceae bacterium]MDD2825854.1 hypothetical protein [Sulfurospirillaceae bacterium]